MPRGSKEVMQTAVACPRTVGADGRSLVAESFKNNSVTKRQKSQVVLHVRSMRMPCISYSSLRTCLTPGWFSRPKSTEILAGMEPYPLEGVEATKPQV